MKSPLASRLAAVAHSATIAMAAKARVLKAAGADIISLSSGEPDFDTPPNVKAAAIRAINAGDSKYTDVVGTRALREAVSRKFQRDSGIAYTPEEIIVSTGGKQVIFNALMATMQDGDEAVIPSPCWVSYPDIVKLVGGTPVIVSTGEKDGFKLTPDALEAAISSRTKWIILNNPCNPTGAAYSAEDLRPLTDVLLRYPDVWILTDDIYEKLAYDDLKPATIAEVDARLKDRTVTMNGCSKAYAMTGWRIGFAGAPRILVDAMSKLQSQSTSNACSISQAAALEALDGPQDSVVDMVNVYRRRRDMVVELLNRAPGIACRKPEGAFYVFPSIQGCLGKRTAGGSRISSDQDFVVSLLEETGVAAVHGSAFLCPGYFRVSYAASDAHLLEACARIRRFCEKLQ